MALLKSIGDDRNFEKNIMRTYVHICLPKKHLLYIISKLAIRMYVAIAFCSLLLSIASRKKEYTYSLKSALLFSMLYSIYICTCIFMGYISVLRAATSLSAPCSPSRILLINPNATTCLQCEVSSSYVKVHNIIECSNPKGEFVFFYNSTNL